MSHDAQTRAVVQEVFDALRDHDLERFRSLLHPEAVLRNPSTGAAHEGPESIAETLRPVLQAFPDLTPKIKNLVVDGQQAAVEVVRTGTHTAPLKLPTATIPATNEEVALPECLILEVEGDEVRSITAYTDRHMLSEQLNLEERLR